MSFRDYRRGGFRGYLAKSLKTGPGSHGSTRWYIDDNGQVIYGDRPAHDSHNPDTHELLHIVVPQEVLSKLKNEGELESDQGIELFPIAYSFMRKHLKEKVKGYGGQSLWWAWQRIQGQTPSPEYAARWTELSPVHEETPHYLLTLSIPKDRVVLSSHTTWTDLINDYFDLSEGYGKEPSKEEVQSLFNPTNKEGETQGTFEKLRWSDVVRVRPLPQ